MENWYLIALISLCNETTMATPTGNDANFHGKKLNVLVYSGLLHFPRPDASALF